MFNVEDSDYNRMQQLDNSDTTSLSYWLNWRVLICSIWVFTPMVLSFFIIWKYERFNRLRPCGGKTQQERANPLCANTPWRPCFKQIHPIWLLTYRVIAFCFLLASLIVKVSLSGLAIFFFYTQWTFAFVTILFGFGSLLSVYGCFLNHEMGNTRYPLPQTGIDAEQEYLVPLTSEEVTNVPEMRKFSSVQDEIFGSSCIASFLFQVLFQITAGAAMLTDCVYWAIIFPYFTIQDYPMNFMTVNMHTVNVVLLLGDAALNCLPFPWFRISYFILWTGVFVIFQWILHACLSIRWPYPFLDLASPYAPLWYFLMASMHVPCYGVFVWVTKMKRNMLSKEVSSH